MLEDIVFLIIDVNVAREEGVSMEISYFEAIATLATVKIEDEIMKSKHM